MGGERGFFTGAAVGLLYMVVGYALYWQLGGALFSAGAMLLEMLAGGICGAAVGAVCANLRPPRAAARQHGESMTGTRRP